jgi:hypothetical protein
MTVDRASRLAIQQMLPERLQLYDEQGGLGNRAPFELIRNLLPDATIAEQEEECEKYIAAKLGHTRAEIGTRFGEGSGDVWPRLVPGYRNFHQQMQRLNDTDHIFLVLVATTIFDLFMKHGSWERH